MLALQQAEARGGHAGAEPPGIVEQFRAEIIALRTGRVVPLAALVGEGVAHAAVADARHAFERLRDSTLAQVATRDEDQAARALRRRISSNLCWVAVGLSAVARESAGVGSVVFGWFLVSPTRAESIAG